MLPAEAVPSLVTADEVERWLARPGTWTPDDEPCSPRDENLEREYAPGGRREPPPDPCPRGRP